jgi:hypothetical protein
MNRRQQWRKVIEAEVQRCSALPYDQLQAQLATTEVYEVVDGPQRYQVEIDVLENTKEYVHVLLSLDDGSLPSSLAPVIESFITNRSDSDV